MQVQSLDHLKSLAQHPNGMRQSFFIILGGGAMRSSKEIYYDPKTKRFDIVNDIDGSFQLQLTEKRLARETHIIAAIEAGTLYKY